MIQTAYFAPKGLFGLLYWYLLYPIHGFIFSRLIRELAKGPPPGGVGHAVSSWAAATLAAAADALRNGGTIVAPLPAPARDLLASGPLAHVVTLNRDGSPQVSCTWITVDGDELVIATLGEGQKIKNLRRDPRITLSFRPRPGMRWD